jgi:hypothetical protein
MSSPHKPRHPRVGGDPALFTEQKICNAIGDNILASSKTELFTISATGVLS